MVLSLNEDLPAVYVSYSLVGHPTGLRRIREALAEIMSEALFRTSYRPAKQPYSKGLRYHLTYRFPDRESQYRAYYRYVEALRPLPESQTTGLLCSPDDFGP